MRRSYSRLGSAAVYDSDFNITWLANANLAASNTFGVSGINPAGSMTWDTAQSWISAMDGDNYLGYRDWRQPTTLQPDATCQIQTNVAPYGIQSSGYNCIGSEMGHLFYNELGGVAGQPIGTIHNANYNLFTNVLSSHYWFGTEYAPDTTQAWRFSFYTGDQIPRGKINLHYVWAVRTGDVAAVPVPAAVWLFGSGLIGLIGKARRTPFR